MEGRLTPLGKVGITLHPKLAENDEPPLPYLFCGEASGEIAIAAVASQRRHGELLNGSSFHMRIGVA
jgi:hypothetical protein